MVTTGMESLLLFYYQCPVQCQESSRHSNRLTLWFLWVICGVHRPPAPNLNIYHHCPLSVESLGPPPQTGNEAKLVCAVQWDEMLLHTLPVPSEHLMCRDTTHHTERVPVFSLACA